MASELNKPDLTTDPEARLTVKDETVWVEFATETGDLISTVGRNRYQLGDALITGSTGDPWCVARDRFDAKYDPLPPTVRGERGRVPDRSARPTGVTTTDRHAARRVSGAMGGPHGWILPRPE